MTELKIDAKWTDDCQGKKDYDGEILTVSTRYWPHGGGFDVFGGSPELLRQKVKIKPSAHSSILLRNDAGRTAVIAEESFEGETQEEVQRNVEEWAQARFDEIVALLKTRYDIKV